MVTWLFKFCQFIFLKKCLYNHILDSNINLKQTKKVVVDLLNKTLLRKYKIKKLLLKGVYLNSIKNIILLLNKYYRVSTLPGNL